VENEIWQYYQTNFPGQVQALGADMFNGSQENLESFRDNKGITFPLLRNGGSGAGNENLYAPYVDRDNYAVIDQQGVVRYHAYDHGWQYNNRYHRDEIRAAINALTVSVGDLADPRGYLLRALPNPFRSGTTVELSNPRDDGSSAAISVHDIAGRQIATLWRGPNTLGTRRVTWDGRAEKGARVSPGVYLIRASVGNVRLATRVVVLE